MLLLLSAAAVLAAGNEGLADTLAEYAYYILAAGVMLLIASQALCGEEDIGAQR